MIFVSYKIFLSCTIQKLWHVFINPTRWHNLLFFFQGINRKLLFRSFHFLVCCLYFVRFKSYDMFTYITPDGRVYCSFSQQTNLLLTILLYCKIFVPIMIQKLLLICCRTPYSLYIILIWIILPWTSFCGCQKVNKIDCIKISIKIDCYFFNALQKGNSDYFSIYVFVVQFPITYANSMHILKHCNVMPVLP
jgi:hypothetical protein